MRLRNTLCSDGNDKNLMIHTVYYQASPTARKEPSQDRVSIAVARKMLCILLRGNA